MNRYLIPAILSAALIVALVAINRGTHAFLEFMGAQFAAGFIAGAIFVAALVAFIMWIDPDSRPRGSSSSADQ